MSSVEAVRLALQERDRVSDDAKKRVAEMKICVELSKKQTEKNIKNLKRQCDFKLKKMESTVHFWMGICCILFTVVIGITFFM